MTTVALEKGIKDETTGAVVSYHVIEYLNIDYRNKQVTATTNGYYDCDAHRDGRNPMLSKSATFEVEKGIEAVSRENVYPMLLDFDDYKGGKLIDADAVKDDVIDAEVIEG